MASTTIFESGQVSVLDYRCTAQPGDKAFVELHDTYSLSYVRTGSFGYRSAGKAFELVAGSLVVGRPGEEYVCTHDHVHGDECLSFRIAPSLIEAASSSPSACGASRWRCGAPPRDGRELHDPERAAIARHDCDVESVAFEASGSCRSRKLVSAARVAVPRFTGRVNFNNHRMMILSVAIRYKHSDSGRSKCETN